EDEKVVQSFEPFIPTKASRHTEIGLPSVNLTWAFNWFHLHIKVLERIGVSGFSHKCLSELRWHGFASDSLIMNRSSNAVQPMRSRRSSSVTDDSALTTTAVTFGENGIMFVPRRMGGLEPMDRLSDRLEFHDEFPNKDTELSSTTTRMHRNDCVHLGTYSEVTYCEAATTGRPAAQPNRATPPPDACSLTESLFYNPDNDKDDIHFGPRVALMRAAV
ncbi:hypothetical protein OSTOST_05383, partial [Ostertagia ostertagi]